MGSYTPGYRVQSCTGDPGLPDGTCGTVTSVGMDYGDGIEVTFDDGRQFNVLACGLDPA
ncbi:hypothetical protein ACPEIF_20015 [Streptomyces sp. NPDC012600]|uniref:hypothetical protein n=1 Tax=Streptomyces sp. NPDC012600 TaxID=3415005 RepID=UPI003C302D68